MGKLFEAHSDTGNDNTQLFVSKQSRGHTDRQCSRAQREQQQQQQPTC